MSSSTAIACKDAEQASSCSGAVGEMRCKRATEPTPRADG